MQSVFKISLRRTIALHNTIYRFSRIEEIKELMQKFILLSKGNNNNYN